MLEPIFTIDGQPFELDVVSLTREFSITQAAPNCVTMDGTWHREPLGSLCHYQITLRCRDNQEELERFWEVISQPKESILCCFPYGQQTLTQRMYVESGSQKLLDMRGENRWDSITVRFLGLEPRVRA